MKITFGRQWILTVILLSGVATMQSQHSDCGTPTPTTPLYIPDHILRSPLIVDPIMLDIIVHVFADDNGTDRAAEDSSIIRQLENMQEFYAPHDICFNLLGIRQINNSDLNNHNADTEEGELAQFRAPNTIDIFVHEVLVDNDGNLNGSAYGIPNTYFSVVGNAIQDSLNRSTTAHEMGHCLGLYHTFETLNNAELVDRIGTCANCLSNGDLLCDTEADPHSDTYDTDNWINTNCNYFGTVTDDCDNEYNMDPHNVMAYGRRACRDIFTAGQGSRMHAVILINPDLTACITATNVSFSAGANTTNSSGWALYSAQNAILVQGNTFTLNGTARGHFSAPYLRVIPKVHFNPGQGGYVQMLPGNTLCD